MKPRSPFWLPLEPLILASASDIRHRLLVSAGIRVDVQPGTVDERSVDAAMRARGSSAGSVAMELARKKALDVSAQQPGRWVLGADQTLDHAGRMLHKPATRDEARANLNSLSGTTHTLISAAALARDNVIIGACRESANLSMRPISPVFIDAYLAVLGDATLQSLGGYQIEAEGSHLFSAIEGDWPCVLGLPLLSILALFRSKGLSLA